MAVGVISTALKKEAATSIELQAFGTYILGIMEN